MLSRMGESIHRCFGAWLAIQRPFAHVMRVQRSIDDPIGPFLTVESGEEATCRRF